MSMAGKCKVVRGSGGARKVCWGANGRIKSNVAASGTAGLPRPVRRRRKAKAAAARRAKPSLKGVRRRKSSVSRASAATFVAKASYAKTKSGKLRKGCKKVGSTYRCRRPGK
jgi:hypothetical protein